jgi:preprotein translocase subunit YajC
LPSSSWMLIIYVVAFIAIFYFMAIRPQQRQRRAHQSLLSTLKRGDTIQTAAGIYGKVKKVDDATVVVEVAKGVNMKIARRAVVEIVRDSAEVKNVAPDGATGARGKRAAQIEEPADDEYANESTETTDESDQDSSNGAS